MLLSVLLPPNSSMISSEFVCPYGLVVRYPLRAKARDLLITSDLGVVLRSNRGGGPFFTLAPRLMTDRMLQHLMRAVHDVQWW